MKPTRQPERKTKPKLAAAMPLDAGAASDLPFDAEPAGPGGGVRMPLAGLHGGAHLGEALRAIRERRGLTLEELAETTRVRAGYLDAIEEMRLELLPSRPFTIGYIRAYAEALGLDPDSAIERFRADEPVLDEPLRAPVGVMDDRDPRLTTLIVAACFILIAIVLWNIAQRAMRANAPPPPTASEAEAVKALAAEKPAPVVLGAPLPAPVESTTPPPYETPGLAEAHLSDDGKALVLSGAPKPITAPPETTSDVPLPPTFKPAGAVYGAPPKAPSVVTIQALKPVSLIIRGTDGSVYFARQLAAGEAYRAPQIDGLTAEVSTPQDVQVFVGGASRGLLPGAQVALNKLAAAPAP